MVACARHFVSLEKLVQLCDKQTGAVIPYETYPVRLLDRLIDFYRTEHYCHPNCSCAHVATGQPRCGAG